MVIPPPAAGAAPAALSIPSSYEPPDNFDDCTAPLKPPPESSFKDVSTILPFMHCTQCLPATRPKTTQSNNELPPRRLLPCTPPATSPAAYRPGIFFSFASRHCESTSIAKPPMQ